MSKNGVDEIMGKKGHLIILSGPSGVGKGTVRRELFKDSTLNLAYSISMTTRPARDGEQDGVDYFFVTKEKFEKAIEKNELLEHAIFVNNYYGTPLKYVNQLLKEGKNVVLEIEVEGATQVLAKCPHAISVFLVPPSLEALETRIRNRKSEPESVIRLRLQKAQQEMELKHTYEHVIMNDDVTLAKEEIANIIRKQL